MRSREQERILQHNSELPPQFLQIEQANVDPVQEDLPALNIVKTQQQGDQRRFPRASVTDNRESLPRRNAERNVAQHPILVGKFLALLVTEPHIPKLDLPPGEINFSAFGFDSMVIGSSSSLKMRSDAAIADCKMLNFSLKS